MKIQITKQLSVNINDSTLLYIGRKTGNIPAQTLWDARGLTGHNRDGEKISQFQQKCIAVVNSQQGQTALREFLDETLKVFDMLTHEDKPHINQYLENKKIIFITGIMRSGGSFLLSELSKIHRVPYLDVDMAMVHDRIPKYEHFYYSYQSHETIKLLFDLAQFLVWANRELKGHQVMIKKHQTLSFSLPLIDNIFGENATYIATYRHPLATAISTAKLDGIDLNSTFVPQFYSKWEDMLTPLSTKPWVQLSFYEKFLLYYEKLYTEFAKHKSSIQGNIIPLSFGSGYEAFLKDYAHDKNLTYTPEHFLVKPKNEFRDGLKKAEDTLAVVKKYFKFFGMEFPKMDVL